MQRNHGNRTKISTTIKYIIKTNPALPAAYLKAAEGLAGEETGTASVQGAELWALVVGAAIAVLLVLVLLALLCRLVRR